MIIGVPKEVRPQEGRVALTPAIAKALIKRGHEVYIQSDAGAMSRFPNEDFLEIGVKVAYTAEEIYGRADVVIKVSPPVAEEYQMMRNEQVVMAFFHMAVARREWIQTLLEKKITAIGYEVIEEDDGSLPILIPMSEICGELSVHIAAQYLQSDQGGRGVLLGGLSGVPPAIVVILGGGVVGTNAARAALGLGAQVILLDNDIKKLRRINELFGKRVITSISNHYNIEKAVKFADVLIGAVLIPGQRAPILVTRDMVKKMRPKSIIIDASIDQGGCVETSRPTTIAHPVFVEENVIHYCVPNSPAKVARTATYALTNAMLPYLLSIVQNGLEQALKEKKALARGVYTYKGYCTNKDIAEGFSLPYHPLESLLPS